MIHTAKQQGNHRIAVKKLSFIFQVHSFATQATTNGYAGLTYLKH